MLTHQINGWAHSFFAPASDLEYVLQISIESKIARRRLLPQHPLVKIPDRGIHFFHGNISASAWPYWVHFAELFGHAIHVADFFQRRPSFISFFPVRARREPDGKGLSKILIRMLLRIPAFHVTHKVPRKRD